MLIRQWSGKWNDQWEFTRRDRRGEVSQQEGIKENWLIDNI